MVRLMFLLLCLLSFGCYPIPSCSPMLPVDPELIISANRKRAVRKPANWGTVWHPYSPLGTDGPTSENEDTTLGRFVDVSRASESQVTWNQEIASLRDVKKSCLFYFILPSIKTIESEREHNLSGKCFCFFTSFEIRCFTVVVILLALSHSIPIIGDRETNATICPILMQFATRTFYSQVHVQKNPSNMIIHTGFQMWFYFSCTNEQILSYKHLIFLRQYSVEWEYRIIWIHPRVGTM